MSMPEQRGCPSSWHSFAIPFPFQSKLVTAASVKQMLPLEGLVVGARRLDAREYSTHKTDAKEGCCSAASSLKLTCCQVLTKPAACYASVIYSVACLRVPKWWLVPPPAAVRQGARTPCLGCGGGGCGCEDDSPGGAMHKLSCTVKRWGRAQRCRCLVNCSRQMACTK